MSKDQLPPHSVEAERGYLGCVFLDAYSVLTENQIQAELFYDLRHAAIYEAMVRLYEQRKPVDMLTVTHQLRETNQLDLCGGAATLSEIIDSASSAANNSYHSDVLREKYYLRRKLSYHIEQARMIQDFKGEIEPFIAESEMAFREVQELAVIGQSKTLTAKEFVDATMADLEQRHQAQGIISGLSTGIQKLDKLTGGYQPGDFVVIGARPNDGKSSFAMFTVDQALDAGIPVGIITMEMSPTSLGRRLCAIRSGIGISELKNGDFNEDGFKKLVSWAAPTSRKKLWVEDAREGLTSQQTKAKIQKMSAQHGIKLWILEGFIQDMRSGLKSNNRTEEIQEVCRNLKSAAEFSRSPSAVITLAQLNREKDKEKGRWPKIADLGDSCGMERKADLILLLHREYSKDDPQGRSAGIVIGKQRDGGKDFIPMTFIPEQAKWAERSNIEATDYPN